MATDEEYFNLAPGEQIEPEDEPWAGEDMADDDDDTTDDDDEVGSRGDALIGLFDVANEEERKEFFGSTVFQDWLAALLKKHGVQPISETAPPAARVQPFISPAAMRLAQKAAALWAKEYP